MDTLPTSQGGMQERMGGRPQSRRGKSSDPTLNNSVGIRRSERVVGRSWETQKSAQMGKKEMRNIGTEHLCLQASVPLKTITPKDDCGQGCVQKAMDSVPHSVPTESPDTDSSKHQIGKGSLKVINNIRQTWELWDKPGAKLIFGLFSEIPYREPFPPLWRRSRMYLNMPLALQSYFSDVCRYLGVLAMKCQYMNLGFTFKLCSTSTQDSALLRYLLHSVFLLHPLTLLLDSAEQGHVALFSATSLLMSQLLLSLASLDQGSSTRFYPSSHPVFILSIHTLIAMPLLCLLLTCSSTA